MLDRSGKPPDTLQHPIPLQHAPDATLAVKLYCKQRYHYHSGFRPFCQSKTMSVCRSCFSFIYYDSSFHLHFIFLQPSISSRSSITLHHFSASSPREILRFSRNSFIYLPIFSDVYIQSSIVYYTGGSLFLLGCYLKKRQVFPTATFPAVIFIFDYITFAFPH